MQVYIALLILLLLILRASDCWTAQDYLLEAYYINLDRSIERRNYMEVQLKAIGLIAHRIAAVRSYDIDIPEDSSMPPRCNVYTKEPTPTIAPNFTANPARGQATHRIFITGMCGRPKNSKRELAVTVSHMLAMREAMQDKSKKYALILEDDMKIVFPAMNWTSLIESAPDDFAVLQLITSNGDYVQKLWNQYTLGSGNNLVYSQGGKQFWVQRNNHDLWCAGAYIINKEKLRGHIEHLIKEQSDGRLLIKVIAGYDRPCFPKTCCKDDGKLFSHELPCVFAPRGYQADHFLFMLGKTYAISVPPITSASLGNKSTFHQDHVNMHQLAFTLIDKFTQEVAEKKVIVPVFYGII